MSVSITGTRSELGGILARRRAASATGNIHINVAGQQANTPVARRPRLERLRPHGAGRNAPCDARGANGRRADARPRELRLRARRRAGGTREGAAALVGRCDPRMRSAGAVGSGARLRRASRLSVRPARAAICAPIAPPFVSAGRTGPDRARRCSTTSISSMPPRPCSPPPDRETRERSSTPPTVARFRSCS